MKPMYRHFHVSRRHRTTMVEAIEILRQAGVDDSRFAGRGRLASRANENRLEPDPFS